MASTGEGCGCPPTTTDGGSHGVHHLIINATDLERSRPFYAWLMPRLGYPGVHHEVGASGWFGQAGSFWVKQAHVDGPGFDKDRVGLCEIAFRAGSRAEVDGLAGALGDAGVPVLHPPRAYDQYVPGYYAVFFTDPDGIKLELVHIPE